MDRIDVLIRCIGGHWRRPNPIKWVGRGTQREFPSQKSEIHDGSIISSHGSGSGSGGSGSGSGSIVIVGRTDILWRDGTEEGSTAGEENAISSWLD